MYKNEQAERERRSTGFEGKATWESIADVGSGHNRKGKDCIDPRCRRKRLRRIGAGKKWWEEAGFGLEGEKGERRSEVFSTDGRPKVGTEEEKKGENWVR